jgi:large subunit ribosomal protein L2
MGKRIISQARGKGSSTYRVKCNAFKYKLCYPRNLGETGKVLKLLPSSAHTAPLAKVRAGKELFYIPAFKGMLEGQTIEFETKEKKEGNILKLKDIPVKSKVYCVESKPGDGGKFIKTGGSSAEILRKNEKDVFLIMPSKKELKLNGNCRAIIGIIAGAGRLEKPIVKAGKNHYIKKAKNKLWPRTSARKVNAIDHPFGSGRGKVAKSKIAKRNAPPGAKVGLVRPNRTGKRK